MTPHTPGPWVCKVGTNNPYIDAQAKTIYPAYVLNPTAVGTPAIPQDEAWANARLIAAAPDLLEALKTSRGQWIHSVNAPQCLAALAKAEGAQ